MKLTRIGWFLGNLLVFEIVAMLPCLLFTANHSDTVALGAFLKSLIITAVVAVALLYTCRRNHRKPVGWEMFICAGAGYLAVCLLGALPFWLSGRIPSYLDSLFEITSGFTTTGASVLADVTGLGTALLFWRSFSQWLGGFAMLLFFLIYLPANVYRSGHLRELLPHVEKTREKGHLFPMVSRPVEVLGLIYGSLTLLEMLALKVCGLSMFDACCLSFSTTSTGGFTVLNTGLSDYSSAVMGVILVFMLLSGVNYALYLRAAAERRPGALRDEELRFYLILTLVSTILVTAGCLQDHTYASVLTTLGQAAFQVISVITTTGFTVAGYGSWVGLSLAILYLLMWCGGCMGTTSGGIKIARSIIMIKSGRRTMQDRLTPHHITVVRINGKTVPESTIRRTGTFLIAYLTIIVASFLLVSFDPAVYSLDASFSAVIASINNIGTGIAEVSWQGCYGGFSPLSKLVLLFDMLAGRLEFFPLAALLAARSLLLENNRG